MKYHLLCLALGGLLTTPLASAEKSFGNVTVDEVRSIYDGDTFRVTIQQWPAIVGDSIPVRINAIDTPEMRGHCAQEIALARQAKQHTVARLRGAKRVELRNIRRGKYFRLLADVYTDQISLAQSLLDAKLAVPYNGGKKHDWCK